MNSLAKAYALSLPVLCTLLALPTNAADKNRPAEDAMQIELAVYAGRTNPQWSLAPEQDEYKKLVEAIKSLEPKGEPLFEYAKWNRLGYASFWIRTPKRSGLPAAVHVWRDMAVLFDDESKEAKPLYAVRASELYEQLVSQAEDRKQGGFFINYRKRR